jgi:hypothetical protein
MRSARGSGASAHGDRRPAVVPDPGRQPPVPGSAYRCRGTRPRCSVTRCSPWARCRLTGFLDCPAYLDREGTVRCGLPAEVTCWYTMRSTDGPLESARISCPTGHHFNGPIESLTWNATDNHDSGTAGLGSRAGHNGLQRDHDGRDGGIGSAVRDLPAGPERKIRRPNGAPASTFGLRAPDPGRRLRQCDAYRTPPAPVPLNPPSPLLRTGS